MLKPDPSRFQWQYSNATAPNSNPGTSVTPGASNAEGSATVIATGSNIAEDVYGVLLVVSQGSTATAIKNHLLDIGFDPAGGTSYDWIVENLGVGSSGGVSAGQARALWLPIFIPAGSQVAVRIQGNNATAGTVNVWATFFGRPSHPEQVWAATYSENIGTITTSAGPDLGTNVGQSAAEGTWVSIGTCSQRLRYLLPCVQMNDSSTNAQMIFLDVAVGTTGSNTSILQNLPVGLPGTSEIMGSPLHAVAPLLYCDIPAGSEICVRASTTLATRDNALNVNLVGLG